MDDIELLVTTIEKFPCIWNVAIEDYHNRDLKDRAWESICKEMFTDWENIDENEKKWKCAGLKKKWANVRDCYRRNIQRSKNPPAGFPVKKHKRYVYADVLSFLPPVNHEQNSDGNDVSLHEIERNTSIQEEMETYNLEQSPSELRETISTSQMKEKKKKDRLNKTLEKLQQQDENQKKQTDGHDDDDTMFLLSFRTEMKQMSTMEKIDFKMGMLELMKNILQPAPCCSNYYNTPSPRTRYP